MKVICAYPVNVDALHNLSGSELEGLCSGSRPEFKDGICSLDDFCSSLLHCMKEGSGGELLIESPEVASRIDASFSWQYRLGGNAGIMANVLAALGASPVLNAPCLSKRLAGMLDQRVGIPVKGVLALPDCAAAGEHIGEDMIHFVLQFSRGEAVGTGSEEIVAPNDNRFIASFDPQNSKMASTQDFDSYCQREIKSFDGALVSGFHLAKFSRHKEIFQGRIEQIESWKAEHPGLYVHAEMGSFQRPEMMKYLLSVLPVDSIGMNEDELAMLKRPDHPGGWKGIHDAVMNIMGGCAVSRLAVHTRDFIISASEGLFSPEEEIRALFRGTQAAGALAATGKVGSQITLDVNPGGLEAWREFCEAGASSLDKGAYKLSNGTLICLVPALRAAKPKITVGLGDTTTAAIFYEEARALKGIK
ncbi:MAG: hypothetical protein HPY61_10370 [Methanotrichaceae archaeon]|nr:hypothetical protein [Methanotrichaceae archaeon]